MKATNELAKNGKQDCKIIFQNTKIKFNSKFKLALQVKRERKAKEKRLK